MPKHTNKDNEISYSYAQREEFLERKDAKKFISSTRKRARRVRQVERLTFFASALELKL